MGRNIPVTEKLLHYPINNLSEILIYGAAAGAIAVTGRGSTQGVSKSNIDELLAYQGKQVRSKIQKL